MTTDFLLTVREADGSYKQVACAVKYTKDLEDLRTVDKLQIEKEFWNSQGVEWSIVSEEQFTINLINNLGFLRKFASIPRSLVQANLVEEFLRSLKNCDGHEWKTSEALRRIASSLFISYQDAKQLYLHLIWVKRIKIDLVSVPIQTGLPLPVLEIVETESEQAIVFGEVI